MDLPKGVVKSIPQSSPNVSCKITLKNSKCWTFKHWKDIALKGDKKRQAPLI